jgi:hypothetical protein
LTLAQERRLVDYNGQWNDRYASESVGGPTEVNLTELARVVQRVVNNIETKCDSGDLRLVAGVTPDMVWHRWVGDAFELVGTAVSSLLSWSLPSRGYSAEP